MAGTTGTRAATSHWLPNRKGPNTDEPGTGRADSAESHSLAIPAAAFASAGSELNTRSSFVIQKVLDTSGMESSEVNVLVLARALPAAAACLDASTPSLCNSGSILPA